MQIGHASRYHIDQNTVLTALLPVRTSGNAVQHTYATRLETLVQNPLAAEVAPSTSISSAASHDFCQAPSPGPLHESLNELN